MRSPKGLTNHFNCKYLAGNIALEEQHPLENEGTPKKGLWQGKTRKTSLHLVVYNELKVGLGSKNDLLSINEEYLRFSPGKPSVGDTNFHLSWHNLYHRFPPSPVSLAPCRRKSSRSRGSKARLVAPVAGGR